MCLKCGELCMTRPALLNAVIIMLQCMRGCSIITTYHASAQGVVRLVWVYNLCNDLLRKNGCRFLMQCPTGGPDRSFPSEIRVYLGILSESFFLS
jgi:hypothetical protein